MKISISNLQGVGEGGELVDNITIIVAGGENDTAQAVAKEYRIIMEELKKEDKPNG